MVFFFVFVFFKTFSSKAIGQERKKIDRTTQHILCVDKCSGMTSLPNVNVQCYCKDIELHDTLGLLLYYTVCELLF